MYRAQRVRDPLHNLIEFGANEFEDAMWRVVQTGAFQRLRRVKQLGLSELVYPGATHSRFAHSLGVFHTARRLMKIVEAHLGQSSLKETKALHALAAALVHDVGHGPFSHAFEAVGKRLELPLADHERISDRLIREGEINEVLNKLGSGFSNDVADVIKTGPGSIYSAVVSSQFDADRLDYMRRDRLMTGTQHGAIDFEWLMANLEVGSVPYGVDDKKVGEVETFVLGSKAVFAAESYVLGLFQLYPTVYFHKATRGAEKIFGELLFRIVSLARESGGWRKTGLPKKHPLLMFAKDPDRLDLIVALDDSVLWGALSFLTEADDETVKDLSRRLRDRRLYKCIDVRERMSIELGDGAEEEIVEQACQKVDTRIAERLALKADVVPRIISDRAEREPYKRFQESKGPLNQILIRTGRPGGGELIDLVKRSKVVAAIKTYKLYRVYVSDTDSAQFVEKTIKEAGANGSAS